VGQIGDEFPHEKRERVSGVLIPLSPPRSLYLWGFAALIGGIASVCGAFICSAAPEQMAFRRFTLKLRPKSLLAGEAVPSVPEARCA
jgi:hypothetical protein